MDVVAEGRKISYGIVQPGEFSPGGIPLIRGKDYSFGWTTIEELFRVSAEIDHPYRRSKVRPKDLLLTIVGAGTGKVAVVPDWLDGANITQTTARISVDHDRFDYRYVKALLESEIGQRAVRVAIKGGAQPGLNIGDVELFSFYFPTLNAQRQIAELLSAWDQAIDTVQALIANARQQKAALVQALLTGRNRLPGFSDEWYETSIGEVCEQVTERAAKAVHLPVLSCSKHDGFVESLNYFGKKVFSDNLADYKVVHRGMIAFPTNHIEEGSIALQAIADAGLVSPIYCVFQTTAVDRHFLINLLKTDAFTQRFAAATNASVDRRGSLRWREFSRILLNLPSRAEQVAIASVIADAGRNAATLTAQLAALRKEKGALMQQLLTGKRRVKLDEASAA
ncbi:MAG TPA: restriction endonuclease subunit S [Caulobacteraceae bacterium]|jgi:type I restriction enzyme S subunit